MAVWNQPFYLLFRRAHNAEYDGVMVWCVLLCQELRHTEMETTEST